MTLFWQLYADRHKDLPIILHTLKVTQRVNRLITLPTIAILSAAGFLSALIGKFPLLHTPWIVWSIVLFAVAGLADGLRMPILLQMLAAIEDSVQPEKFDWARHQSLSSRWTAWSIVMLGAAFGATVLMVLKPDL
jgi:MFS family permease